MGEESKVERPGATLYFLGAAVMTGLIWAWFLIEHFTNWRITRFGSQPQEDPLHIAFPLIVTPVVLIGALVLWRRAVGLAENGVPVNATIRSIGGEVQGYRDVVFDYTFEGASYSTKKSVIGITVAKLQAGEELPIIVDKRNPKRVMVK